ncbi:hypothetical protein MSAN_01752800 [Mycena sanguinolenta]|uniref:Uncharacterized protein n=1 Tax=Mycena sanguinolenta TaxID=230812 RepID=A0A8H6XX91_9AGAR|nr:hypothetical protein MSAN_01752800 [Mycena sanguinolenta]
MVLYTTSTTNFPDFRGYHLYTQSWRYKGVNENRFFVKSFVSRKCLDGLFSRHIIVVIGFRPGLVRMRDIACRRIHPWPGGGSVIVTAVGASPSLFGCVADSHVGFGGKSSLEVLLIFMIYFSTMVVSC